MPASFTRRVCATILLGSCLTPMAVHAQRYPDKPVQIVVPFAPGGALDAIGRIVGQKLGETTGKSFLVDNKPGFSGNIGSQLVAKAPRDGYTLLITSFTTAAISNALTKGAVGYALGKELVPIATLGTLPIVLIASNSALPGTYAQMLATAKAKPGSLSFGSAGSGSIEHVAGELFKRETKLDLLHVPYKGGGPAMTDLLGGQIQLMFATGGTALVGIKSGKARPLAIASGRRTPTLQDVPTLQELGLPGFDVSVVYGVLAPAGLPPDVLATLQAEIAKVLQQPDTAAKLAQQSVDALISSPEQSQKYLEDEMKKWDLVVREANIKGE